MNLTGAVECAEHGRSGWCLVWGREGHRPIRPVLEALAGEVNRHLPPDGRVEMTDAAPGIGTGSVVEVVRTAVGDWFPRTLAALGLTEMARRARAGGYSGLGDLWREMPMGIAVQASIRAYMIAGAMRWTSSPLPGWQASRRDYIGREAGDLAGLMLEAHRMSGLTLDLRGEINALIHRATEGE